MSSEGDEKRSSTASLSAILVNLSEGAPKPGLAAALDATITLPAIAVRANVDRVALLASDKLHEVEPLRRGANAIRSRRRDCTTGLFRDRLEQSCFVYLTKVAEPGTPPIATAGSFLYALCHDTSLAIGSGMIG